MFLSESAIYDDRYADITADPACGYQIIMESEEMMHNLEMAMVKAEHTAIMNEDGRLLQEAELDFKDKAKNFGRRSWERFKVYLEKVIVAWSSAQAKFSTMFLSPARIQLCRQILAQDGGSKTVEIKGVVRVKGLSMAMNSLAKHMMRCSDWANSTKLAKMSSLERNALANSGSYDSTGTLSTQKFTTNNNSLSKSTSISSALNDYTSSSAFLGNPLKGIISKGTKGSKIVIDSSVLNEAINTIKTRKSAIQGIKQVRKEADKLAKDLLRGETNTNGLSNLIDSDDDEDRHMLKSNRIIFQKIANQAIIAVNKLTVIAATIFRTLLGSKSYRKEKKKYDNMPGSTKNNHANPPGYETASVLDEYLFDSDY